MAAAAVVALGSMISPTSAGAATSWTVTPAGAYAAHAAYPFLLTPYADYQCDSSDVTDGHFSSTDGATGTEIGTIDAIGFENCSIGGIVSTLEMTATPWKINVVGHNASNADWADVVSLDASYHLVSTPAGTSPVISTP
ncbi:hypothetical protein [Streptomyces sp. NPDC019224]|uniref:hypothetical protein n=1 Tax=Streptomyces sp. NPDC019224 TaxID=3154484 RepID=UPI0033F15857